MRETKTSRSKRAPHWLLLMSSSGLLSATSNYLVPSNIVAAVVVFVFFFFFIPHHKPQTNWPSVGVVARLAPETDHFYLFPSLRVPPRNMKI